MRLSLGNVERAVVVASLTVLGIASTPAATPPALVNYQGVLRDATDKPLSGTYDILFRFMDAATAGNEIMVDQHAAVTSNAIAVSGGLFNVALGSGSVTDGSGPGTYMALDAVFRDYGAVWLEVKVGGETLSPRTPVQSAAYALNATSATDASQLNGQPASHYIDTSASPQIKNGTISVYTSNDGDYALVGQGGGTNSVGVYGSGTLIGVRGTTGSFNAYGGYFNNFSGTFGYGLYAKGPTAAGHFESAVSSGVTADLATSNSGIAGSAPISGGIGVYGSGLTDGVLGMSAQTGGKFSGGGTGSGILASGPIGGRFYADGAPGSSIVEIATTNIGVHALWGGTYAGYFEGTGAGSIGLYALGSAIGVNGDGTNYGGSFSGNSYTGVGVFGTSPGTGVQGHGGSGGGGFFDNANSGNARLAYNDYGLLASGTFTGGEFRQGTSSGAYARLAYNRTGVAAYASAAGENPGFFQDLSSSSYASIGLAGYKIVGSGAVSFVQNDPESPSNVIVYAAPEGDEVAVYTRGSARLVNGEARVPLGPTFRKVANPELGLTANVTPIGDPIPLAVAKKTTSELVVRGPAGSNAEFDYVVWGLRIGFEDRAVVQPKQRESFIPSRDTDNAIYQLQPELRKYSARQRYLAELARRNPGLAVPRMDKGVALEQAIGVYDRARDLARIAPPPDPITPVVETRADVTAAPRGPAPTPVQPIESPAPTTQLGVAIVRIADTVQPGDVVVADPSGGDALRLGAKTADPLLAGIVVAPSPSMHLEGGEALVALAGSIVACRVDATQGDNQAGDLLTSSPTPGYAMRAADAAPGTILGKALQDFNDGTGTIRVLIMSR